MDAQLINPFIKATINVVSTMAGLQPEVGAPRLKKDKVSWGRVTGIIGLAGYQASGNMLLSFDEGSILKVVSKMLMEDYTAIDDQVVDAVGELTNMISGGAKKELNDLGFFFEMATPIVVVGQGVEITQLTDKPVIAVPFQIEEGSFVLEASLSCEA